MDQFLWDGRHARSGEFAIELGRATGKFYQTPSPANQESLAKRQLACALP